MRWENLMKAPLMGVVCVLVSSVSGTGFAAETMRIAMGAESSKISIKASALEWGPDAEGAPMHGVEGSTLEVTQASGGLQLNGAEVELKAVRVRVGGADDVLTVNGVRVRGEVVVQPGRAQLVAINVLPLEDYLLGVLGSEMPRSFPLEALKAQAVAARTYALNKKLEQYDQPYHLGSSVISQVYKGLEVDDPRTREAVESTRGEILTWKLQPIEAYFHASCGGHTEAGLEALGRDLPYLKSVECPCGALPTSHWSVNLTSKDLVGLAGAKAGSIRVEGRTPTGRARRVQVGSRDFDAVRFRERVGYMKLKSLDFEVKKAGDGVELSGHGFGHGAGMCQWGARVLADKGMGYTYILQRYYPGTDLQNLY